MSVTEVVFVLDRSGSMCGLEDDVVGGFNSFIEKQKHEEGTCYVTTVLFDHEIKVLHDHVNIKNIKALTNRDYEVRGSTALLDAVGYTIQKMIKRAKKESPDHVVFIINTDGYENASREFSYKMVSHLIQTEQKLYDWQFLFLGARIDATKEASKLGIHASRAARFYPGSSGVQATFNSVSKMTACVRSNMSCDLEDDSWKDEVETDYMMNCEKFGEQ